MIKFQLFNHFVSFKNSAIDSIEYDPDNGRIVLVSAGKERSFEVFERDDALKIFLTRAGYSERCISYPAKPSKKAFKTAEEWEAASDAWEEDRFDFWAEACDCVMAFAEANA